MWLWISNLAVLFGQELNAEIERGRELTAGLPAERDLQLEPRDAAQGPRGQGRRGLARGALPPRERGHGPPGGRVARAVARDPLELLEEPLLARVAERLVAEAQAAAGAPAALYVADLDGRSLRRVTGDGGLPEHAGDRAAGRSRDPGGAGRRAGARRSRTEPPWCR